MNRREAQELWMQGKKVRCKAWPTERYLYRGPDGTCLDEAGNSVLLYDLFGCGGPNEDWEEYVKPEPEEEEIEYWWHAFDCFGRTIYRTQDGGSRNPDECKRDKDFRGFVFHLPDGREKLGNDFRVWVSEDGLSFYPGLMPNSATPLKPVVANAVRMAKANC